MFSTMGATMVQPCTAVCTAGEDPNLCGERPNSFQTRRPVPLSSPIDDNASQISLNRRKIGESGQHLEFENGGYCDENQFYNCPETFALPCKNSSELSTDLKRPSVSSGYTQDTSSYKQAAYDRKHEPTPHLSETKNVSYSHGGVYSNCSPSINICEPSHSFEDCDSYRHACTSPYFNDAQHSRYRSDEESFCPIKYPYVSEISDASYANFKSLDSKGCESPPRRLYQKPEGKVVIRPIAYRPAAPSPAQLAQGLSAPSGPIAGVGGRPPQDPRYTSTPALPRGTAPHYGSLGDLKSLGYSLDRRGLGTPLNHGLPPPGDHTLTYSPQGPGVGHPKHASLTHLHHVDHQPHSDIFIYHQNSSKNNHPNGNSSSIYSNTNTASLNHSCDSSNLNNTNTICDSFVASPRSLDNSASEHTTDPCDSSPSIRSSSLHKPPAGHVNANNSLESPQTCILPNKHPHGHQNVYSSSACPVGPGEPSSILSTGSPLHRTNDTNTQRFETLKNCSPSMPPSHGDAVNNTHNNGNHHSMISSTTGGAPSSHHQHHYHHLHHHHHRMGGSVSNLSRLSAAGGVGSSIALDRSASVTGASISLTRAGGSVHGSMTELDDPSHQTPSPSDSGVAELEAILKEKDSEISLLKESMEQSEQIIFKVYEEKEKTWERELKKIRDICETRLKASQQKVACLEQSLASQTYQIQQERRKVTVEAAEARRERDAARQQQQQLQHTIASLRSQLEETEWGLCQKSGEISLLKSQLKDCQGDQTSRGHELLHLRAQLRQYALEVERRRTEVASLHELSATLRKEAAELRAQQQPASAAPGDGDADQLRKVTQELALLREERVRERERITEERSRWQQEKESVLRYQRQLQLACQHAQRTNRRLQQEVTRLQADGQPAAEPPSPPAVPPLPPGYNLPPSPLPPPPGVLSEEALC